MKLRLISTRTIRRANALLMGGVRPSTELPARPQDENQGRGPRPAQIDGAGIVIGVLGGALAWPVIVAVVLAVVRLFE